MSQHKFQIRYLVPGDGPDEVKTETVKFEDTPEFSLTAEEWANDWAYALADKGWYSVTEIEESE